MKKKLYLLSVLSLSFLAFVCNTAWGITVRIDQPKIRLSIPNGGTENGTINIENPSAEMITVRVYLEDWRYASTLDGSKDFYPPGSVPLSCARWISFAPAEFSIPPYGKKGVNYTVNCPPDARGGRYAVMFFETALGKATDETGVSVMVLGRLGSLFCIEPQGTIKREAELTNLTIVKDEGLNITLDFANTGNIDIAPEGTFYLMDKKGIIAARGKFEKVYTLPGNTSILSSKLSKDNTAQIPEGEYDLIVTIDLGGTPEVLEAKLKFHLSGKITYSFP